MAVEIERKFLVKNPKILSQAKNVEELRQGYLPAEGGVTVRVRLAGSTGFLTIKGPTEKISRLEFEYEIPKIEAEELLGKMCQHPLIEKLRHVIHHRGTEWVVDEFKGENSGLLLAEVELETPDQKVELPDWLGEEVSHDPRFFNSNLQKNPYTLWQDPLPE